MAEPQPTGGGTAGTGENPAIQPEAPAATNGVPEGYELIKTDDKNNLISARDQANEKLKGAESADALLGTIAMEREQTRFLKENADKYPDVELSDLANVWDPADLPAEAAKLQRRFEDITQKKLQELEVADRTPKLTAADQAKALDEIRYPVSGSTFQQMVKIRTS